MKLEINEGLAWVLIVALVATAFTLCVIFGNPAAIKP